MASATTATGRASAAAEKEAAHRMVERQVRALMYHIRRSTRTNAAWIHPDLSVSAYRILLHIGEHEPTRAAEMVDALDMDKAAVSRNLAQLQELGLIERRCDPADRRANMLRLSRAGRADLDGVTARRRAASAERLRDWTVDELHDFAGQLARFVGVLGLSSPGQDPAPPEA